MRRGHFFFGLTIWLLMMILPVTAMGGTNGGTAVTPQTPAGETVTLLHSDTGQIETLPMETYLFGVAAAEMPMSYPKEAIKAQIVAAYSVTLSRIRSRQDNPPAFLKGAQMTDDSGTDQGYLSPEAAAAKWGSKAAEYRQLLTECVAEVKGQYLSYNGQPATAVYHDISAGRTESAQTVWGDTIPYLVPVASVGDLTAPGYISEKTVTKTAFAEALQKAHPDWKPSVGHDTIGTPKRSESGMVTKVTLLGETFTGKEIRKAFSLRSANFDVTVKEDTVVFTVRGHGHLVGMSQFGAGVMAAQGSSYREILSWYYPGCTLEN